MQKKTIISVLAIILVLAGSAAILADYRQIENDRNKAAALMRIGKGKRMRFEPGKAVVRHAPNKAVIYTLETLDRIEPGPEPKTATLIFKSLWFGFETELVYSKR